MSDDVIRRLLESRLNGASAGFATAWENVPFSPVQGTPYQAPVLLPAQTQDPTMGDGYSRPLGIFQVTLVFPAGAGAQAAQARAKAVLAHFPKGLSLTEGAVTVRVMRTPWASGGASVDGWYRLPVSIPYEAEVFG